MKKIKIIMTFIIFILSFPIHFIYEKFPSFITSILFPVNESIWEHMKIIYTAILISSVIEYLIYKIKKTNINNFIINIPITSILGIITYLIIYSIIDLFIPHNFIITLILLFITYALCEYISYKIITSNIIINQKQKGICLILLSYIIFTHLTYYPPRITLFIDPINKSYGIPQKILKQN